MAGSEAPKASTGNTLWHDHSALQHMGDSQQDSDLVSTMAVARHSTTFVQHTNCSHNVMSFHCLEQPTYSTLSV